MSHISDEKRFTRSQRIAHGAIILLFIVQLPTGEVTAAIFPTLSPSSHGALLVHTVGGGLVLLIGAALFIQHLMSASPPALAMPGWQLWAARIVHYLLLALMVAVPVSGMAALAISPALAPLHTSLVGLTVSLVTLHAAAALFHHFVQRDTTLRRMF